MNATDSAPHGPQADPQDGPQDGPQADPQDGPQDGPEADPRHGPLTRPVADRMLTGVSTGIARYLGVDVLFIRIAFVVLGIWGPGVLLYLACWLLIPEEGAPQSIASDMIDSLRSRSRAR